MRWIAAAGLLGLAVLVLALPAQADEYWIAPTPRTECNTTPGYVDTTIAMVNTGVGPSTVTVERADGWQTAMTVAPMDDAVLTLSGCAPGGLGHRIAAAADVSVSYFHDYTGADSASESGHLLDGAELGRVHRIVSTADAGDAQILVVAPQDGTLLSVTTPAGATTTAALDRLDAWYASAPTGSWLVSNHPVAVYAGDDYQGDFVATPVLPASYLGSEYVACHAAPFRPLDPGNVPTDILRIVPLTTGSTHVDFDPAPPGVPAAGLDIAAATPFVDVTFPTHLHISADQPILVLQVNEGSMDSAGEVLVPTSLFWMDGAVHSPPSYATNGGPVTGTSWTQHYVQFASPAGATASVDGIAVTSWTPVGDSAYQCGHAAVSAGRPHFAAASAASQITAWGFGDGNMADVGYMHLLYSGCLPAALPAAPTGLAGTAPAGAVTLTWTPSADDGGCPITEQRVYRSFNGAPYGPPIQVLPADADTTTDNIPLACPGHSYHVTAVSAAGESAPSNEVTLYHRYLPGAPAGSAAWSDPGLVLTWSEPPSGGCPITTYTVYALDGSIVGTTLDPRWLDAGADRCATHRYTVTATTAVGEGPASALIVAGPPDRLACTTPGLPPADYQEDADADGAPDENDPCPADAGHDGCPAPAPTTAVFEPLPCPSDDLMPRAPAAAWSGSQVRITWQPPPVCTMSHFLVWNGSQIVARVPYVPGQSVYAAWDERPWHEEHVYWVQGEPAVGPDRFVAARAAPTNAVAAEPCDCAPPPASETSTTGAHRVGALQARDLTPLPRLVVIGLPILALLAVAVIRSLMASRQFTRLSAARLEAHPVRSDVMEAVRADPGVSGREVAAHIGRPWSTTRHHLRMLVAAGLVRAQRQGRTVHYVATDAPAAPPPALRSRSARRLLQALLAHPEATISDLSRLTGLSRTAVDHQLRRMEDAGLLAVARSRGGARIDVHDAAHALGPFSGGASTAPRARA